MEMSSILMIMAVVGMGIVIGTMLYQDFTEDPDLECKMDCVELDLEFHKVHEGFFRGQTRCICVDDENKPYTIW